MTSRIGKYGRIASLAAVCLALTLVVVQTADAAEPLPPWRKLWDTVMLFVNFGILVFLFIRYARKPLMDYLRGIRERIENELGAVRHRLDQTRSARDEEAAKLETIDEHIREIQENIMEIARREKENIIEQGRQQAEKILKDAENYATYKTLSARKALREQMVDLAITMAEDRLARRMTEDDNRRLVEHFIRDLATSNATGKSK